jgi:hypothetical protein
MYKTFKFLFAPEGTPTGGSASGGTPNVEMPDGVSDKDILNGDDDADEVPATDGDEEESVPDEEEDEESEEDDETREEDADEEEESDSEESDGSGDSGLEDLDPSDLVKSVKKAAPELFKKVPGLREALERDKEFGEIFSNPQEAKQAAQNAHFLDLMYRDISSGDVDQTGNFLKALKTTNEASFEDFSHTILESIGKINPQLYGEVMLKPMKKALMSMYADALKSGNKNLAAVAIHAHNYWFETQDIKAPLEERKKSAKSPEQEEFEKEKQSYENTKLQDFRGSITEVVNHSMKLSITKELDGIKLDDYQKRNVIRDIFTSIDEVLGSDKRYLGGIQTLFDQAKTSKYSSDWKSKIVKAYLQRARQALPAIRNKVLREAGIKVKEQPKSESRRLVPAGLGGNKSEDKIDFSRVDRSRTTDMDILNGKPKYIK